VGGDRGPDAGFSGAEAGTSRTARVSRLCGHKPRFRNFHRVSEHVAYKRLNPGQVYNVSRPARSTKTPGLNVSLPELTVFGAI